MAKCLTLAVFIIIMPQGMDRAQGSPPQPAIGDIKLVSNHGDSNLQGFYEVLIYFSNGVDQPDYGGICADDSYSEEAEVICNQLGYTYVDFGLEAIKICPNYTTPYFTSKNTNHLVWLKDVFCKQSDQHILRCRHNVTYGRERINQNTCAKKLHIKCDFNNPLPPYNGKLTLCPTDSATHDPNVKLSVSSGIVSMYLKLDGTWRGLDTKTLLGTTEANTICRQMGFTGAVPGSAVALSASDNTFKTCLDQLRHNTWMRTDAVRCPGPQKCFGCCYTYPPEGACEGCDHNHTLIISCTFDPTAAELSTGSSGSKGECKLNSANQVTHCESGNSKTIYELRVGLGIVTTLLIILGIVGFGYLYKKYIHQRCMGICRAMCGVCRRCGYRRVGGHQQNNNDEN